MIVGDSERSYSTIQTGVNLSYKMTRSLPNRFCRKIFLFGNNLSAFHPTNTRIKLLACVLIGVACIAYGALLVLRPDLLSTAAYGGAILTGQRKFSRSFADLLFVLVFLIGVRTRDLQRNFRQLFPRRGGDSAPVDSQRSLDSSFKLCLDLRQ